MPRHIHIDYEKIHLTARKGILRSAAFLGLGVNAADAEGLKEYRLTRDTRFQLLPDKVTDETILEWKKEFRVWVVGCGFRELVDRLCVFLDQIHHASSIVAKTHSEEAQAKFEWLGLDKKITRLGSDYGIKCPFGTQLASYYPIRNCFVHRLGHVGVEDTKGNKDLRIRFVRFFSIFTGEDGAEIQIPDIFDPKSPPFITPSAGTLGVKWAEDVLSFKRGDWISLSPKNLTEILFFTHLCTVEFTKSAIAFAKSKGVKFAD